MTADQSNAVKDALSKHLRVCPVCASNQWTLHSDVSFIPQIQEGMKIDLTTGQPCVTAACRVCGSVQFFNVFFLGLEEKFGFKRTPEVPSA